MSRRCRTERDNVAHKSEVVVLWSGSEDPDVVDIGGVKSMQEGGADGMHKEHKDYKNAEERRERWFFVVVKWDRQVKKEGERNRRDAQ
jgi:hypothetical protein